MDILSLNAQHGLMRAGTPLTSEGQPMYVCSFNALNSGLAAVASLCENRILPSQMNGRTGTTLKNSFWVKAFLGGTRWLREGNRNLLRLLTILERMTNNNRVGSNVDLFCKLYYNFDQNGPGQGWFDPALLFSSLSLFYFLSSTFFLPLSFTEQSYLSLTYMDNVMP